MTEVQQLFKSLDGQKIKIKTNGLVIGVSYFTSDMIVKYREYFGLEFYYTLQWSADKEMESWFMEDFKIEETGYKLKDKIHNKFLEFKNTYLQYACTIRESDIESFKCNYYEKRLSSIELQYENSLITLLIEK